jgi:Fic family protein
MTEWINWFLICLDRAMAGTDDRLVTVMKKARFWEKHSASPLNDRQRIILNKLLDGFEGRLTSSKRVKITKSSQDSAVRDINDLVQRGVLVKEPGGGTSTSYVLAESNSFSQF